ncbi:MAG TPA: pro-sigmaK processing inhibitor BofA family protein [Thermoclostridium sp.]|nr:pro-sigmaK processing inhibitor BofA [Clostridiaceae bacterium]HOQ75563.1 pro-sigmaK processing inhibitor BofA family protein [Thermoclostridium sp.]HPU45877.1 pro-sigmaK processing inhibitor BofA family protein [Thermoclostridium sp.]
MDKGLIVLAWVAGVLIVLALGKALLLPMKIILKLIINGVLGGLAILLINLLGQPFGLFIPLNIVSALVAGILGLPGIILLVILGFLL